MRPRIRSVTAVALGLLLAVSTVVALAVSDTAADAAPARAFRQVDIRTLVNTCNGESVPLLGVAQYVIQPNPDGTSSWHVAIHSEGAGSQGNEYVFNAERRSTFAPGGGFEIKVDAHEVLVSRGPAPNMTGVFHFDSTTGLFSFVVDCTG